MICSAGLWVTHLGAAIGRRPWALHEGGSLCQHRIYRGGVMIYDGATLDSLAALLHHPHDSDVVVTSTGDSSGEA